MRLMVDEDPGLDPRPVAVITAEGETRHWGGGAVRHTGATCQKCGRAMASIWDIDLADPLVPAGVRAAFPHLTRLPLLMCWQCLVACYRVTSDDAVETYSVEHAFFPVEDDETPFAEVPPSERPRRPLKLRAVPEALIRQMGLDSNEIDEELYHATFPVVTDRSPYLDEFDESRLGGPIAGFQGTQSLGCPNPECDAFDDPSAEERTPQCLGVAMVDDTSDPQLLKIFFRLEYYACPRCGAIGATYSCT